MWSRQRPLGGEGVWIGSVKMISVVGEGVRRSLDLWFLSNFGGSAQGDGLGEYGDQKDLERVRRSVNGVSGTLEGGFSVSWLWSTPWECSGASGATRKSSNQIAVHDKANFATSNVSALLRGIFLSSSYFSDWAVSVARARDSMRPGVQTLGRAEKN